MGTNDLPDIYTQHLRADISGKSQECIICNTPPSI